jgi:hypothetical protein
MVGVFACGEHATNNRRTTDSDKNLGIIFIVPPLVKDNQKNIKIKSVRSKKHQKRTLVNKSL